MVVKKEGYSGSVLTLFDLINCNNYEVALTKSLAFILSKNSKALFKYLHYIGISNRNTLNNFNRIQIEIEHSRNGGRTDIEIKLCSKFHVIIEAKVRNNPGTTAQLNRYIEHLDNGCEKKVLCFISQYRDSNLLKNENVDIVVISWLDIINLLDDKELKDDKLINEFMRYAMKKFKIHEQKEIFVQDVWQ